MTATVLVVEDEPIIRMDIAMHLSDAGFELLEAGSVADALAHLERDPAIRVLFTDIDLAGAQTGVELAAIVARRWPGIELTQDGTHYFDVHHTENDTLDKIDPATLPQNIAAWAAVAWLAAQSPIGFGQPVL